MTTPGGYSAGTIFLTVVPSFKNFQKAVKRQAQIADKAVRDQRDRDRPRQERDETQAAGRRGKAVGKAEAEAYQGAYAEGLKRAIKGTRREIDKIKLDVDDRDMQETFRDIKGFLKDIDGRKINIDADADSLFQDFALIKKELVALQAAARKVNVDVDLGAGIAKVEAFRQQVESLGKKPVDIRVAVDDKALGATRRKIKAALTAAIADLPNVKVDANTAPAVAQVQAMRVAMEKILDDITFRPDADVGKAIAEIERLKMALRDTALQSSDAELGVNSGSAYGKLKAVDLLLDRIDGRRARAKVDVDTDRANRGLLGMIKNFNAAGGSMRAFSGRLLAAVIIIPLLIPLVVALAGALGVLTAALGVLVVGAGVFIVAFTGIADAVKAMGDVKKNAAKDAAASAKTMRAASKTIREAEQGLTRAREAAGEAAESSARQVADAARAREDAERNAADANVRAANQVVDALEAQENAQQDYTDAQRDALRAQERLTEARADAQDQIEDLAISVAGGALAERQAVIDLFEAEMAYRNSQADGSATNLEREQALINLEQQRLRLIQVRQENGRLAEDQARVNALGIEGMESVVSAQDGVAEANEKVADTQLGVSRAAENVQTALADQARTAADGARAIADAQRGVQEAVEAQGRSSRDSAQAIADAQERLADAQLSYQEALYDTGVLGSESMRKLEEAMSKLGPAGQAFATFLFDAVLPFLKEMRMIIQEAMLPGITTFLQTIMQYAPQIGAILGAMAKAFGDFFATAGQQVADSPAWQQFFDMLLKQGPGLLTQMLQLGLQLVTILVQLMTIFAPLLEETLTWLLAVTDEFSKWMQTSEGQREFQEFLDYIREIGPDVKAFLSALIKAIVAIGIALAPYALMLMKFFTTMFEGIANMDKKALGALVAGILSLVFALQAILGFASAVSTIGIAVGAIGAITAAGGIALAIIIGIVNAVVILGVVIAVLWNKSETFRDIMRTAFEVVKVAFWQFWDVAQVVFAGLVKVFDVVVWWLRFLFDVWTSIFDLIIKFFAKFFEAVSILWNAFMDTGPGKSFANYMDYVGEKWSAAMEILRGVWDQTMDWAKAGIKFVIDVVINDGFIATFNKLAGMVGSKPITPLALPPGLDGGGVPAMQQTGGRGGTTQFATGGWTGPGSKYQPAGIVHADEFVIRKESQQKLRREAPGLLDYLNAYGTMPGYASGGVVAFGRLLQSRGFRVGEHPEFGGVAPVHKGRGHYEGRAIDVNFGPGGQSAEEKAAIDSIVGLAKGYGLSTIWQSAGHYGHAHFEQGAGFKDMIGNLGPSIWEGLKDAAGAVIGAPLDYLMGKVRGLYGNLASHDLGRLAISGVEKLVGMAADFLVGGATAAFDDGVQTGQHGPVQDIVRNAAASRGWGSGAEWDALSRLIQKESSWNPTAQNPTSTAYGLFQFLNGTWGGTGFSKSSDPAVQAAAGLRYIQDRYGSPSKALAFHERNNWYADGGLVTASGVADHGPVLYDSGGWLQPGITQVVNASGKPEPIFSASQWEQIASGGGLPGGGGEEHYHWHEGKGTPDEFARAIMFQKRVTDRGGKYAGVS